MGVEFMRKKQHLSLLKKLTLWFVITILLPSTVVSFFLYSEMRDNYSDAYTKDRQALMNILCEKITGDLSLVEESIRMLAYNETVIKLASSAIASSYRQLMLQMEIADQIIPQYNLFLSSLHADITLYLDNYDIPRTYWRIMHIESLDSCSDYNLFEKSGSAAGWAGMAQLHPNSSVPGVNTNDEYLSYYRNVYGIGTKRCAVIKCGISVEQLFSTLQTTLSDDSFVTVLQNEKLIYGKALQDIDLSVVDLSQNIQTVNNKLLIINTLDRLDMVLIMSIDLQTMLHQARLSALPLLLASIGAALMMLIATLCFLRSINRRLKQAVNFAEQAQNGNFDIMFPNPADDEIGQLITSFNLLLEQLQKQAQDRIIHEIKEKQALQLALQYQLNPHFLFNSLNRLHMSLEMGIPADKLSSSVVLLGKLLRYNMDNHPSATLQEEIENTLDYIKLMNLYKRDKIKIDIQLTDVPSDYRVMRFLFQPLCENAIQHGMNPNTELTISINGKLLGESVCFTVKNNGLTIPDEKLELIRKSIKNCECSGGIGLKNIAARIDLYYSENSSLEIYTASGSTYVEIILGKPILSAFTEEDNVSALRNTL